MNLDHEVALFKRVAAGEDNDTRLIITTGEGGTGKSHLLRLLRAIGETSGLDVESIPLGPQMDASACLARIVESIGPELFSSYHAASGVSPTATVEDPVADLRVLTTAFFHDLRNCPYVAPLVVLFDQFEKADSVLQKWLLTCFLPQIPRRGPLIVVVGGRQVDCSAMKCEKATFHLEGLPLQCFYDYADACKVNLAKETIEAVHRVLGGIPLNFVTYVQSIVGQIR